MNKSYSHIIVGAGSAGCVLAARISENPKYNVLLIEAGPDYASPDCVTSAIYNARKVPMRGQSSTYDTRIDWKFDIEMPNVSSSMQIPQARLLGGGSSINGGTALRSTRADSREWVAMGNDLWDFESVYEVYQALEDDPVRGTHGPHPMLRASSEELGKIQKAFVDGAIQNGFEYVSDLNAPGAEGVGASPVCRKGDRRISLAKSFIDPIRERPNFTLLANTQVDRILSSPSSTSNEPPKAIAVLLTTGHTIPATHEIIISAGSLLSPAILQRSGIGPSSLLSSHNIPLLSDLPVGANLSDHPCIPLLSRPRPGAYDTNDYSLQMQTRWSSKVAGNATDLQLVAFSYLYADAPTEDVVTQARSLAGNTTGHVTGIGCNINKPASASLGTVKIRSRDPMELPVVEVNYLESKEDRALAREVVRRGYEVLTSEAMQAVLEEPIGLTEEIVRDDEKLDGFARANVTSTYHFTGTCRMAGDGSRSGAQTGVVDQEGRVYGVSGLRVCDASILPTVPAANTMWTTVMFAERIGGWIRDGGVVNEATKEEARL